MTQPNQTTQPDMVIINVLSDDFLVETTAGQLRKAIAQVCSEAVEKERERIIKKYGGYIENFQYKAQTLEQALQKEQEEQDNEVY